MQFISKIIQSDDFTWKCIEIWDKKNQRKLPVVNGINPYFVKWYIFWKPAVKIFEYWKLPAISPLIWEPVLIKHGLWRFLQSIRINKSRNWKIIHKEIMTTNHRQMRILQILVKIFAYLHNQSEKKKKITSFKKSSPKKVQNLMKKGKKNLFLRPKNRCPLLVFRKITVYLCDQCKQKLQI